MKAIWFLVYGWVTGIAAVIVLILYGFDVLVCVMRAVARLVRWLAPTGSHTYTALYANSFIQGLRADGTAQCTHAHSDDVSVSSSSSSDDDKDLDGSERAERPRTKTHKSTTAHNKQLYGKVSYDETRSLREQGLEGMTSSTATIQPMKLSTPCIISWFDESRNTYGPPIECRLFLSGRVITVYQLLLSSTGASGGGGGTRSGGDGSKSTGRAYDDTHVSNNDPDANVMRAEHMKGKIHTSYITSKELKKFNKENKEASALTPFTGRVLVLASTDGRALFAQREEPPSSGVAAAAEGSRTSLDAGSTQPPASDAGADPLATSSLNGSATYTADSTPPSSQTWKRSDAPKAPGWHGGGPMIAWESIIIKFRRSRDTERWNTLLNGIAEAEAWRQFAKSMPNPDTLNTLLSRFFFQNMRSPNGIDEAIKKLIRKQLVKVSQKKFPRDLQGELLLDDFIIGTSIPWVSDVSEPAVSTNGEVGFDFNLLYKGLDGGLELFFRLALQYRGIRVPHVWFSVKLLELEATAHISIGPPPSKKFWMGGHKLPVMRLEVHQGCACGSGILHRILTSLPDLSGIFTNLIKLYLFSDMILPVMDDFPLPSLSKTPKTSPRDTKSRTFDRKRAAQHSAAPALTGIFTRQQLREMERLLRANAEDAQRDPSSVDDADPHWHPLTDQTPESGQNESLASRPFSTPTPAEGSEQSNTAKLSTASSTGATHGAAKRGTLPPPILSAPSPHGAGAEGSATTTRSAAGTGHRKVSFPAEYATLSASTRSTTGPRRVVKTSAVAPREVSGSGSGVGGSGARPSAPSSRDVLMASVSSANYGPDFPAVTSPTMRRMDASTRSRPGAMADDEESATLAASQRGARPIRSIRTLLKFKGDEMSKASVVRRKMKKEGKDKSTEKD